MQNGLLWEAVLKYLEGQVHTERTVRISAMGPVELEICNECRATVAGGGHFSDCETGKLIATIRCELDK